MLYIEWTQNQTVLWSQKKPLSYVMNSLKKQELVCNIGPILLVVLWHRLYYQGDLS